MNKSRLMLGLKILALSAALWTAAGMPAASALAAPAIGGNIVNFADTAVPAGTTVENVIVVGGNATIAGTVTDEVVVLNGNATLTSTAHVRDRVIVLGGKLNAEDGAYVGKGVFRIGGDFALAATLLSAGFLVMLLWFVGIAATAGLVVIPAAVAWGFRTKVEAMAEVIREHAGRTVLVGLLGGLAVAITALILAFTIVGIPLAVLLILAAGLTSLYGLSGVCCQLGRSMPLNIAPGRREVLYRTLCGAVLLALVFNVPLAGLIAIKLGLITGFGAVILSAFAKWAKPPHDAGRQ